MLSISIRSRWSIACLCAAVVGTSALLVPAFADDMKPMGKDMPMTDTMMSDQMAMMKDGMKDDAGKMQMTSDLAKLMVMHDMAMKMCADDKCMMMMKQDEGMMKLMSDAKAMAADADKMSTMREQIMKDPASMKMVMEMSMAHTAMMADKMDTPKMDSGKMDAPKMDGGKMMK